MQTMSMLPRMDTQRCALQYREHGVESRVESRGWRLSSRYAATTHNSYLTLRAAESATTTSLFCRWGILTNTQPSEAYQPAGVVSKTAVPG